MLRRASLTAALAGTVLAGSAMAQTADGYGTLIRVPVAVNTSTFGTDLFIHNPNGQTISVAVQYYGADGTTNPGARTCTTQNIAAGNTRQVSLASLCGFVGGSNFGHLRLQELNPENVPFAAYTRVQAFSGDGFSIEGFKIGSITGSAGNSWVTGLRRQASGPGYQTNCFLASMAEPVGVNWNLQSSTGATIGSAQTTNLAANQMVRFLDVFSAVGAPAGDYNNVTARFSELGTGEPGYMAFCTVQNNTTFDADFRFAKEQAPADQRSEKFTFSGTTGQGVALSIPDTTLQHELGMYLQHPDWVQCSLSGSGSADLEMRLKDPQGNIVAGGNDVTSFGEVYLGERSTRNNGINGLWTLEVENGSFALSFPKAYSVSCQSGNGSNRPLLIGTDTSDGF